MNSIFKNLCVVLVSFSLISAQDGVIDYTFANGVEFNGEGYYMSADISEHNFLKDSKVDDSGNFISVGTYGVYRQSSLMVTKFSTEGIPNEDFDNNSGDYFQGTFLYAPSGMFMSGQKIFFTDEGDYLILVRYGPIQGNQNIGFFKLTSEGEIDDTFGDNGLLPIPIPFNSEEMHDSLVKGDYIYATINADDSMHIYSFDFSGNYNPNFGTEGLVTISTPSDVSIDLCLLKEYDNSFYALASNSTTSGGYSTSIHKFTENGSVDTSYGNNGVFTGMEEYGHFFSSGGGLFDSEGNLVLSMIEETDPSEYIFKAYFVKILNTGEQDMNFGNNGVQYLVNGDNEYFITYKIMEVDDSWYVTGANGSLDEEGYNFFITRINQQGIPDTNFGTNGFVEDYFRNSDFNIEEDPEDEYWSSVTLLIPIPNTGDAIIIGLMEYWNDNYVFGKIRLDDNLGVEDIKETHNSFNAQIMYNDDSPYLYISENVPSNEDVILKIHDIAGQQISTQKINLNATNITVDLSLEVNAQGIYIVTVESLDRNEQISLKFIRNK